VASAWAASAWAHTPAFEAEYGVIRWFPPRYDAIDAVWMSLPRSSEPTMSPVEHAAARGLEHEEHRAQVHGHHPVHSSSVTSSIGWTRMTPAL